MTFILASSSQRRQQLLKYLISDFEIITAEINEEELGKLARTPQEMVMNLARAKARRVYEQVQKTLSTSNNKNSIQSKIFILGSDTTVVISNGSTWQSIGKPKDKQEAKIIIQTLRNKKHQVYTGICLIIYIGSKPEKPILITDFDISTVTFGDFSDQAIDNYIATGTVMDKAGAYAVQDIGKEFKITIDGSYSNVVGLPIEVLLKHFDKIGLTYNTDWQSKLFYV